jgi:hypothetical protein
LRLSSSDNSEQGTRCPGGLADFSSAGPKMLFANYAIAAATIADGLYSFLAPAKLVIVDSCSKIR